MIHESYSEMNHLSAQATKWMKNKSEVMIALLLQHHSQDPSSNLFENVKSQPSSIDIGSICSGTGALRCKNKELSYDESFPMRVFISISMIG